MFAAASGFRRGEMLALKCADIDPKIRVTLFKSMSETKAGLVIKSTKSHRTRFVRVSPMTIQILLEDRAQIEEEKRLFGPDYKVHDLVFPTPAGDYYTPGQVTGHIIEFMRETGVQASLHTLRHFNASVMVSKHVPITVVSKRLGHANSQITLDIYAHAMKSDELTASKLWEEATEDITPHSKTAQNGNLPPRWCYFM